MGCIHGVLKTPPSMGLRKIRGASFSTCEPALILSGSSAARLSEIWIVITEFGGCKQDTGGADGVCYCEIGGVWRLWLVSPK